MSDSNYSLREACWIVLGGVGAISPLLYGEALHRISEMTGITISEQFRRDGSAGWAGRSGALPASATKFLAGQ